MSIFSFRRYIVLFCLFVWVSSSPSKFFTHIGCHNFRWRAANFDQYICSAPTVIEQWGFFSLPHLLSYPFKMVITEDPWHSHLLPSLRSAAVTICFCDLGLLRQGFEHYTFCLRGKPSNRCGPEVCVLGCGHLVKCIIMSPARFSEATYGDHNSSSCVVGVTKNFCHIFLGNHRGQLRDIWHRA